MMPDMPNKPNPRAIWFRRKDAQLSMERLARHGRTEPKKMSWDGAQRAFRSWILYFVALLYTSTILGAYATSYFSVFLKSLKNADGSPTWSVAQVNAIPIVGGGINVIFVWVWALLSDYFRTRWTLIVAQAVLGLIPCIIMSFWTSNPNSMSMSATYVSYFIMYMCQGTSPLIFSWLSDLVPRDSEARTLMVGAAVATYYAISAWAQIFLWPASEAPYYKHGWNSSLILLLFVVVLASVLRFIDVRYMRYSPPLYDHSMNVDVDADVVVGRSGPTYHYRGGLNDEEYEGDGSKGPHVRSTVH